MRLTALYAAVLAFMLAWSPQVSAEEPGDAIQAVIADQIAAFQRDDLPAAFAHASPSIQGLFGTPDNFGRMVQSGYPMVWRPARWQMDRLLETPAGWVQIVMFEDTAGRLHEAGYLMEQVDGIWRIDGVHVRAAPGIGA